MLNWLLLFVPLTLALEYLAPQQHLLIFISAAVAIIPLAGWLGRATEQLAECAGDGVGGLLNATFGSMYRDAQHAPRPGQHPGMHRTATVDYALMLQGELVAIMDKDETVLRAGDVLIQRGTHHAWANRSGAPARVAFVLVAGRA